MKGPVPIPIYKAVREKYEAQILAAGSSSKDARDQLEVSIEQEFVDAANAQGFPGQAALPHERIAVDLDAAKQALAAAKGDEDIQVARILADAAKRASDRINS